MGKSCFNSEADPKSTVRRSLTGQASTAATGAFLSFHRLPEFVSGVFLATVWQNRVTGGALRRREKPPQCDLRLRTGGEGQPRD